MRLAEIRDVLNRLETLSLAAKVTTSQQLDARLTFNLNDPPPISSTVEWSLHWLSDEDLDLIEQALRERGLVPVRKLKARPSAPGMVYESIVFDGAIRVTAYGRNRLPRPGELEERCP